MRRGRGKGCAAEIGVQNNAGRIYHASDSLPLELGGPCRDPFGDRSGVAGLLTLTSQAAVALDLVCDEPASEGLAPIRGGLLDLGFAEDGVDLWDLAEQLGFGHDSGMVSGC
jgi:hypothetical protein